MKQIDNQPICKIVGKPFMLPQYDDSDNIIIVNNRIVSKPESSLVEILKFFVLRGIPRDKYTKQDAIHAASTYMSLVRVKDSQVELSDEDYKWLLAKLNLDDCGVRMFAIDVVAIIEACK